MRKERFESPAVIQVLELDYDREIMAGSVVTVDSEVKTTGQEVKTYDFSDTSFNQDWEQGSI